MPPRWTFETHPRHVAIAIRDLWVAIRDFGIVLRDSVIVLRDFAKTPEDTL